MKRNSLAVLFFLILSLPQSGWGQFGDKNPFKAIKPFGTTRAVVVGVSEYAEVSDLDFADRDAEVFADYLAAETRWKVAPGNIRLLTNEEATQGAFEQALKWLMEASQPKDRAIIYFSGHGDVEKVEEGLMGFLLLHKSPPRDYKIGGACPITYLEKVISTLTEERQSEVLLITDACRSGQLAGSAIGGPRLINRVLFDNMEKVIKIMSCSSDQYSLEDERWGEGRGLFSYHLVNGLIGLADEDDDNDIYLYEIEDYIRKKVREDSRKLGKMQIPQVDGNPEIRVNKVDRERLLALGKEQLPKHFSSTEATQVASVQVGQDSAYLTVFQQMEAAIDGGHLMFPEPGSALRLYEDLGKYTGIDSLQREAKNSLIAALQDEAQTALNTYITAPALELSRRWANDPKYRYYPEYLFKAADLAGPNDFTYNTILGRANYFKGLSLRLQAERSGNTSLLTQAVTFQQTSLTQQPNTAHAFNEMGALQVALGNYQQAIPYFQQAHMESPTWVLPLSNLAECYRELENYDLAESTALQALERDSMLVLSQYNMGTIYFFQDKNEAAIPYFEQAIRLDPNYAKAYFNLGRVYLDLEDYEKAEFNFVRNAQIRSQEARSFNALGYLYQQWDKPEKAKQNYQRCLELDPSHRFGLYNLAFLLLKQEQYPEAIAAFERYRILEPDDKDVYYDLACANALAGNLYVALGHLETLLGRLEYRNRAKLEQDADLEQLRKMPAYQDLMKRYFPEKDE